MSVLFAFDVDRQFSVNWESPSFRSGSSQVEEDVTKDQIIHALNVALVEMTAMLEMHRDLIEMLMDEREMYCAITPREEIK